MRIHRESACFQLNGHSSGKRKDEFSKGSRVRVISFGPFRGLKGTIRTVDTIFADDDEPFCFYLIVLEEAYNKEPIWFECDEVELISGPLRNLLESEYLSYLGRPRSYVHPCQAMI